MPLPPASIAGALSGLLLGAATAQLGMGALAFVALVPLLLALDSGLSLRDAALSGACAGVVYFSVGLSWVPLAGFAGRELFLLGPYVVALAASPALFAVALAALRRLGRGPFLAAIPLLWIACELLRTLGTLGYPWHQLGYAVAGWPAFLGLAPIGGLYLISLWLAAANAAWLALPGMSNPGRMVVACVLLAPLPLGLGRSAPALAESAWVEIAAVQPQVRAPGRDAADRFRANLGTLVELSRSALAGGVPGLLVWPESAWERPVGAGGDALLSAVAHDLGVPLLTGAWRTGSEPARDVRNSALLVRPGGNVSVAGHKVHPVPYWEAAPRTAFERWLRGVGMWPGTFRSGRRAGTASFATRSGPSVVAGVLICVDSSYPELARDLAQRGAGVLIEISNEAQSGAWSAHQHAMVSRMRAAETGLPLVRVANAGPSEWIDGRGRVLARFAPGQALAGSVRVPLPGAHPTPFVRWGHLPAFAAAFVPLLAWIPIRTRRLIMRPSRSPAHGNALGAWLVCIALGLPSSALAIDGVNMVMGEEPSSGGETYYETVTANATEDPLAGSQPGLPTELYLSESSATASYGSQPWPANGWIHWTLRLRGIKRTHEKLEALYHMIAVVPLPVDERGRSAFFSGWAIAPQAGREEASVPLQYGGEKVTLKRNRGLERALLPNLVGADAQHLPDLDGTGYAYTMWEAIVLYDPNYGDMVQAFADFTYITGPGVSAPDADDERFKAYLITWIPDLDPGVPPFGIRIDVTPPE